MNVLIFGLGLHGGGSAAARYYAHRGDTVRVTDLRSSSQLTDAIGQLRAVPVSYTLGRHEAEDVKWADIIIKNPAVSPDHPLLRGCEAKTSTDIRELLTYCAGRPAVELIGVSGTKGKSSTVNTLSQLLPGEGRDVLVSGNIGVSGFDTLTSLYALSGSVTLVIELSSFQIRDLFYYGIPHGLQFSSLFLTSLYPDHLDYYDSVSDYIDEKMQLYTLDCRSTYYHSQAAQFLRARDYLIPEAVRIYRSLSELYQSASYHTLTTLAHRNQFIRCTGTTSWYDDSAATIPEATIHTLTEHGRPYILICGGSDKYSDYSPLAASLRKAQTVCLLAGSATYRSLIPLLEQEQIPFLGPFSSMKEAVRASSQAALSCDECDVILSPAAASFSLFRHSDERGEVFAREVNAL